MPQFTKQAIVQSFLKIAEKRPIGKITVRDIVDDCGVNRNTFYYYFTDVYALIEEILTNEMLVTEPDGNDSKYLTDVFTQTILFMLAHKLAILNIYRSVGRETLERMTHRNAYSIFTKYIDSKLAERHEMDAYDRDLIIKFFMHAVTGVLFDWIADGMKDDPALLMRRLRIIMTGTANLAIDNAITRPIDGSLPSEEGAENEKN